MKRREFITLVGGAAAWPLAARAQQDGRPRVGALFGIAENDPEGRNRIDAFRQGAREALHVSSRNVTLQLGALSSDHPEDGPPFDQVAL
jgi:putative ABC transport system substrate-binding protein